MSSPVPIAPRRPLEGKASERISESPDVGWLIDARKVPERPRSSSSPQTPSKDLHHAKPQSALARQELTPPQSPTESNKAFLNVENSPKSDLPVSPALEAPERKPAQQQASGPPPTPPSTQRVVQQSPKSPASPQLNNDSDNKRGSVANVKKEGGSKRSSWMSSLSSKFSSSSTPSPPQRSQSHDSSTMGAMSTHAASQPSPKVELSNPFHKSDSSKDRINKADPTKNMTVVPLGPTSKNKSGDKVEQKIVYTARRPSVLVAAGKETKLEEKGGFLSSAFRRLSSSNNVTMGKEAGRGAIQPRRIMNIDQNRERVKISEFDQNKLRRVAFCVDVEIAGYAAQGDEEEDDDPSAAQRPPISERGARASLSAPSPRKDTKDAKYKEKGEGHALKNPEQASDEKDTHGTTAADAAAEKEKQADKAQKKTGAVQTDQSQEPSQATGSDPVAVPTTRKKEKKKLSEEQRKARKEAKLRKAQANGLIPLEILRDDDYSDSSLASTPPGASTPSRSANLPTTDPLRIYKRCCQLRETLPLQLVKDQISRPSAIAAEAAGTVAVLDLSGQDISLQDITTLGDWLAIVPVRKLVLDDTNLSDEGVRILLSGLAGCRSAEQLKANKKLPSRTSGKRGVEQMCVIEKLSLKNNPGIGSLGWKHIALFLHMSRSLKGIDLTGVPFPKNIGDLSRSSTASSDVSNPTAVSSARRPEPGSLIARAIGERFGDKLEELILSRCELTTANVHEIIDCAMKCKIKRLGLADNDLNEEAFNQIVRYVKSGYCEGLDLGGNNLKGKAHLIPEAMDEKAPMIAISYSGCNLQPADLKAVLSALKKSQNMKFIDLSNNPDLFRGSQNAIPILTSYLPRFPALKRIHFSNCGLTSEQVVALAEILPDCPVLAHVTLLENEPLVTAMNSDDNKEQEEACAYFASLMTAVRISKTIVAIEIEVPSAESSEVIKALAGQLVAYSLRNMEQSTMMDEFGVKPNQDTPDMLMNLVGDLNNRVEEHAKDEPAPDENYLIASTGIVKALGICLGNNESGGGKQSGTASPQRSGYSTPRPKDNQHGKQPRDVAVELCESARKIRKRLQPALVKEDKAGNDVNWRRLFMLDQTLQRMIQRFEDEYPQTKLSAHANQGIVNGAAPGSPPLGDSSILSASTDPEALERVLSNDESLTADENDSGIVPIRLRHSESNTSLAAKARRDEEGRMHRLGASLLQQVLNPENTRKDQSNSNRDAADDSDLAKAINAKFSEISSYDMKDMEDQGVDDAIKKLSFSAKELGALEKEDPEMFEKFKKSQVTAQMNVRQSMEDRDRK